MPVLDRPLAGTFALVCSGTGAGIRFGHAPWPDLPEEMLVESRKQRGAWGRHGLVRQQRNREHWRQRRMKAWVPNRAAQLFPNQVAGDAPGMRP